MRQLKNIVKLKNEDLDFYGLSYKFNLNDRESIMVFLTMQLLGFPEELEQRENYLPYELFKRAIRGEIECLTEKDIIKLKKYPSIFMQICSEVKSVDCYGIDLDPVYKYINAHKNKTKEEILEFETERARKDAISAKAAETKRLNKLKKEQSKNL